MLRVGQTLIFTVLLMGCQQQTLSDEDAQGVSGPVEMCGFKAPDVEQVRQAVLSSTNFVPGGGNHEFERFADSQGNDIVFTRAGHPAHPTVSCRTWSVGSSGTDLHSATYGEARGPACDALVSDFKSLDDAMKASIDGKRGTMADEPVIGEDDGVEVLHP